MSNTDRLVQDIERLRRALAQPVGSERPWLSSVLDEILPGPFLIECVSSSGLKTAYGAGAAPDADDEDDEEVEGAGDDDVIAAFTGKKDSGDGNANAVADGKASKAVQDREIDTVMLRGNEVTVHDWLGTRWKDFAVEAHKNRTLELPDGLAVTPHPWQLTGVAHQLYLRNTNVKGGIIGDAMGLGKTLQGVLLDLMTKDEPGFALVVAPLSCLQQWVDAFNNALKPGFKRKVLKLDNASARKMHAADLQQFDVVITSYAVLQAEYSRYAEYHRTMEGFLNKPSPEIDQVPLRPNLLLLTDAWYDKRMNMRIAIFDEAQLISNPETLRSKAAKDIYATSKHFFSGTIISNRWDDVYGLIALLEGHPITSIAVYHGVFGSNYTTFAGKHYQDKPIGDRVARLQAFLLPLIKARPQSELNNLLVDAKMFTRQFSLNATEASSVDYYLEKFERARRKATSKNHRRQAPAAGSRPWDKKGDDDDARLLTYLLRAQQSAIHYLLIEKDFAPVWERFIKTQPPQISATFPSLHEATDTQVDSMFEFLVNNTRYCLQSTRIFTLCDLYQSCRTDFPDDNIVIFSQQIRVLHLVHRALSLVTVDSVDALRYDGRLTAEQRHAVQTEFNSPGNKRPLLVTAAAGGVGLNITGGNIVIQVEPWWNQNAAKQAWARVWRPGQTKTVRIYELIADSAADEKMQQIATNKAVTNDEIMKPLVRRDADPLEIPTVRA